MPTRSEVISALTARYDAEITGLEAADIERAVHKLAMARLADGSTGGSGGGSGTVGGATEATALLILAELQNRPTIQIVQDLAAGQNLITHNLGLIAPFVSVTMIVDNAVGSTIVAPISQASSNSLVITASNAYPNTRITIKA